ncbi:hypothetical protein CR201_G0000949 [Pongo abelii]|uniref:Uncharacterized protein n=1 Tax=Pongo abelii TaxID=9601 RepID=A0A2J8XKA6_PONAB|nr:hypothetical protein CR201_G0000949 [Pongo abelii]
MGSWNLCPRAGEWLVASVLQVNPASPSWRELGWKNSRTGAFFEETETQKLAQGVTAEETSENSCALNSQDLVWLHERMQVKSYDLLGRKFSYKFKVMFLGEMKSQLPTNAASQLA